MYSLIFSFIDLFIRWSIHSYIVNLFVFIYLFIYLFIYFRCQKKRPSGTVQQTPTAKEKKKIANRFYQPANIRTREAVFVSKIFNTRRQRRNCSKTRTYERSGDHVVSESQSEVKTRSRRVKKWRHSRENDDRHTDLQIRSYWTRNVKSGRT